MWRTEERLEGGIEENRAENISTRVFDLFSSTDGHTLFEARNAFASLWTVTALQDMYGNLPSRLKIDHVDGSTGNCFVVTVDFSPAEKSNNLEEYKNDEGFWAESFDTTGGTSHITRGYNERALSLDGSEIPSFNHCIGWNGESYDGVMISTPS